jgi:hypothetical protein
LANMRRTKVFPAPAGARTEKFKQHTPFLLILVLHLALAVIFSSLVPLGEAPDESAHLGYARFIAENGRLPATLAERQAADYRSDFPPLYYLIIARPLAAVGDTPPTHLKSVGDTPRRLIPTNGQTIAAFIHTTDEAWPWQGLPLAWHLSRFISVVFNTLAVITTYAIAWRLTGQRTIATSAAALHAFIPQALFIGSVLNEDSLLIFLSGLILLTLIGYTKPPRLPGLWQSLWLGLLLGLATISKYNALPLWPLVAVWGGWLTYKKLVAQKTGNSAHKIKRLAGHLIVLFIGVILTSGWWLSFVWRHFNDVAGQGLIRGSLAAFTQTNDTTLLRISAGDSITFPSPKTWLEWGITLFKSFWGLFGGGGSIELPAWTYWLLALICLLAIIPYASRVRCQVSRVTSTITPSPLLLTPFFFLPLPLLRFIMTGGNIAESAQGRHLFPALPTISLALIWGLSRFTIYDLRFAICDLRFAIYVPGFSHPALRTRSRFHPEILLPLFTFILSLYALPLIQSSYPPPIPLHTTSAAATAESLLNIP